jgi:acyl-coenzyme A thioesterase PaaI-like protein
MPVEFDVLSIEYKVNFMSPAVGESFRGVGRVVKAGRTITVCAGDMIAIADGKEKVVATMLATMIAVKTKPA